MTKPLKEGIAFSFYALFRPQTLLPQTQLKGKIEDVQSDRLSRNTTTRKRSIMPTLSKFYGIKITMNYNDHLPPHFHAEYGDQEALVEIATGNITGRIPRRALNLVWAWLDLHRDELAIN